MYSLQCTMYQYFIRPAHMVICGIYTGYNLCTWVVCRFVKQ